MISSVCVCYQSAVMPKYIYIALCSLSGIQHLTCWIHKPHPFENPTHLHTKSPSITAIPSASIGRTGKRATQHHQYQTKCAKYRASHTTLRTRVFMLQKLAAKKERASCHRHLLRAARNVYRTHIAYNDKTTRTQRQQQQHAEENRRSHNNSSCTTTITTQQAPNKRRETSTHARTYAASHMIEQKKTRHNDINIFTLKKSHAHESYRAQ